MYILSVMGCSQSSHDVTPPASLMRKLQESKAGGLMPSVLPGGYKLVPFRAAVVDLLRRFKNEQKKGTGARDHYPVQFRQVQSHVPFLQ